jgi:hypothetical protein
MAPDGRLIAVWDELINDQYRLQLSISEDDGKTWREPELIETDGSARFPRIQIHRRFCTVFWLQETDGVMVLNSRHLNLPEQAAEPQPEGNDPAAPAQ